MYNDKQSKQKKQGDTVKEVREKTVSVRLSKELADKLELRVEELNEIATRRLEGVAGAKENVVNVSNYLQSIIQKDLSENRELV